MDSGIPRNNWVESYLEALVNRGPREPRVNDGCGANERNLYAEYYVRQILGLDEEGLWEAWSKVSSVKHAEGKDARFEYLTWRVWFMKQQKMNGANGAGRKVVGRKANASKSFGEDVAGFDVDGDDNDDGSGDINLTTLPNRLCLSPLATRKIGSLYFDREPFVDSPTASEGAWENRVERMYIVLVSVHGFIRGDDLENGEDSLAYGQAKYVVELAKALVRHPGVYRVDLLTRLIEDPAVHNSYGVKEEPLLRTQGQHGGAFIARIPCGPPQRFLRKEHLWPYIHEFADNAVTHVERCQAMLSDAGEPCQLYCVHGHGADGGEVAALLAHTLGVDMVMTGHSLGRNKLEHLLKSGSLTRSEAEEAYNISRRIEAEERALDIATIVFASTNQDIEQQWVLYDGYDTKLQAAANGRWRVGHRVPMMAVLPPGLDFTSMGIDVPMTSTTPIKTTNTNKSGGILQLVTSSSVLPSSPTKAKEPAAWKEISRFLRNPAKPILLAIGQPDMRSNIEVLVNAFGSNPVLRELANLVLLMGDRKDVSRWRGKGSGMREIVKLIDAYDLYGSVAYPKEHTHHDVSDIYRLCAATNGIFINVALYEPFGLPLIEAAAHGVPIVATQNGGPVDIISKLHNGILIDPTDPLEISEALLHILTTPREWEKFSSNGLAKVLSYSWPSHCAQYIMSIEHEKQRMSRQKEITAFTGSWDNKAFKEHLKSVPDLGEMELVNNDLIGVPCGITGHLSADEHLMGLEMGDWGGLDGDGTGRVPSITHRKQVCAFSFDNQASARTVLTVLKTMMEQGIVGEEGGEIGVGIVSMLSFDCTCSLIEGVGILLDVLDFVICNAGCDLFVAAGGDFVTYEPFDAHIDDFWDKKTVQRVLDRVPNGSRSGQHSKLLQPFKDVHGSSDFGPHHIIMELQKGAKPSADEVSLSDMIKKRMRKTGVRANIVLQVDESPRGALTAPLLHVTPLRACRSQCLRFLMCKMGIPMAEVTVICCATSLVETAGGVERKVGFAVSDMAPLLEGPQRVVVMPPTLDTQVRTPRDGLDAKMIEKLKYEIGRGLFGNRVLMIGAECGEIKGGVGSLLSTADFL